MTTIATTMTTIDNATDNTSTIDNTSTPVAPVAPVELDLSVSRVRRDAVLTQSAKITSDQYIKDCLSVGIDRKDIVRALTNQLAASGYWLASLTGKGKGAPLDTLCSDGLKPRNVGQSLAYLRTVRSVSAFHEELYLLSCHVQAIAMAISRQVSDERQDEKFSLPVEPKTADSAPTESVAVETLPGVQSRLDVLEWTLAGIASLCINSKLSKRAIGDMIIAALA